MLSPQEIKEQNLLQRKRMVMLMSKSGKINRIEQELLDDKAEWQHIAEELTSEEVLTIMDFCLEHNLRGFKSWMDERFPIDV